MKVQSNTKPNPLTIKNTDKAILIFVENIIEEKTEDGLLYSYDDYRLTVLNAANLEKRVTDNFAVWLAKAKQEEYDKLASEARAKRNQLLAETDYLFLADQVQSDTRSIARRSGNTSFYIILLKPPFIRGSFLLTEHIMCGIIRLRKEVRVMPFLIGFVISVLVNTARKEG